MAFQRGQSGNPAGRPKGVQDKRTQLRDQLEPYAPQLIDKAVEMALEGDTTAMKLCLERLIPAMKSVELSSDQTVRIDEQLQAARQRVQRMRGGESASENG